VEFCYNKGHPPTELSVSALVIMTSSPCTTEADEFPGRRLGIAMTCISAVSQSVDRLRRLRCLSIASFYSE